MKDNLHNLTPDYTKERWRAEGKTRSLLCLMSGEKSGTRSRSGDKVFVGILDTELDTASRLFAEDWRTAVRRQNSGMPGAADRLPAGQDSGHTGQGPAARTPAHATLPPLSVPALYAPAGLADAACLA